MMSFKGGETNLKGGRRGYGEKNLSKGKRKEMAEDASSTALKIVRKYQPEQPPEEGK